MRLICLLAVLTATPAIAQDWNMRASDLPLTGEQILARIVGRSLVFYDDGESRFSAGGAYSYTYDGGGSAYGTFEVGTDGVICIYYRNGRSRCDKYVQSGDRLVVLTADGERYPVRP